MNELLAAINENLGLILTGTGLAVGILEKAKKIPFKLITKFFKCISKLTRDDEMHEKIDRMCCGLTDL